MSETIKTSDIKCFICKEGVSPNRHTFAVLADSDSGETQFLCNCCTDINITIEAHKP